MAKDNGLQTTGECAGCDENVDLFQPHLVVTTKVRRLAFVPSSAAPRGDDTQYEDADAGPQIGERTGVGEQLVFHSYEHAADYFTGHGDREVRLEYNQDDSDPYKAGSEVMHGSDQEDEEE